MDLLNKFSLLMLDWPMGTTLGVLILTCTLLVASLCAWGLYVAIDSWFLPRNRNAGRVITKTFTPAHTQIILIYNAATKTNSPHPIFHPDDWAVTVEVGGQQDTASVSRELYESLSINDSVVTEYVSGRFSGGLYIKALSSA